MSAVRPWVEGVGGFYRYTKITGRVVACAITSATFHRPWLYRVWLDDEPAASKVGYCKTAETAKRCADAALSKAGLA